MFTTEIQRRFTTRDTRGLPELMLVAHFMIELEDDMSGVTLAQLSYADLVTFDVDGSPRDRIKLDLHELAHLRSLLDDLDDASALAAETVELRKREQLGLDA